jgi:hypothetical protein
VAARRNDGKGTPVSEPVFLTCCLQGNRAMSVQEIGDVSVGQGWIRQRWVSHARLNSSAYIILRGPADNIHDLLSKLSNTVPLYHLQPSSRTPSVPTSDVVRSLLHLVNRSSLNVNSPDQ